MSGSFERLSYDMGTYCTDLKQSTAPLKYALDPVFANVCHPCRPADVGYLSRQGVSLSKKQSLVDLESHLMLLNYGASRDPSRKFNPCSCDPATIANNGGEDGVGLLHFDECSIKTDYSRITNPPCTLKGTGVNRFQPLCLQPMDENRWLSPSQVGISMRQVITDNWVPVIPDVVSAVKQNPELDPVLPRPSPQVCTPQIQLQPLQACMVNYTSPMYTSFYVPTPTC